MNELARSLFEAHVAHELAALAKREHNDHFEQLSARLFEWLATVTLDDLLTREQVLGVIDRDVIELRISGGIAELVGQIAQLVFTSDASADARLDQLLSHESYRGFAEKVQSLDGAFRELIQLVTHARSFRPLLARSVVLAARAMLFASAEPDARPRASGLAQWAHELKTELGRRFEARLQLALERHADRLADASETRLRELVDPSTVRSLADDLWEAVAGMRLSELFSFLSPVDVEDFVVLAYESWLQYRHTPYFRALCEQVVGVFFAKYGAESAQSFLDDMGVTEAMIAHELRMLVLPLFAHAERTGFLEQQIRLRLEPFYRSDAVAALLAR